MATRRSFAPTMANLDTLHNLGGTATADAYAAIKAASASLKHKRGLLHRLDKLLEFQGVESIETVRTEEFADYLNAGDCYTPTVVLFRGVLRVISLADFLEIGIAKVEFK